MCAMSHTFVRAPVPRASIQNAWIPSFACLLHTYMCVLYMFLAAVWRLYLLRTNKTFNAYACIFREILHVFMRSSAHEYRANMQHVTHAWYHAAFVRCLWRTSKCFCMRKHYETVVCLNDDYICVHRWMQSPFTYMSACMTRIGIHIRVHSSILAWNLHMFDASSFETALEQKIFICLNISKATRRMNADSMRHGTVCMTQLADTAMMQIDFCRGGRPASILLCSTWFANLASIPRAANACAYSGTPTHDLHSRTIYDPCSPHPPFLMAKKICFCNFKYFLSWR